MVTVTMADAIALHSGQKETECPPFNFFQPTPIFYQFFSGDVNTLFRGNSLATKSFDQFMKVVGMPYLHETLKPVIDQIYDEKKLVELDPQKMERLKRSVPSTDTDGRYQMLTPIILQGWGSSWGCSGFFMWKK